MTDLEVLARRQAAVARLGSFDAPSTGGASSVLPLQAVRESVAAPTCTCRPRPRRRSRPSSPTVPALVDEADAVHRLSNGGRLATAFERLHLAHHSSQPVEL
ncbi:MAG: hypothetical protein M0Z46_16500 [Actinomycetota bacterium]|nr:hypothetical protein [Actinomycetota bacterium]